MSIEEKPQAHLTGAAAEKAFKDLKRKGGEVCAMLRHAKNKSRAERRRRQQRVKSKFGDVPWRNFNLLVLILTFFLFFGFDDDGVTDVF